MTQFLNNKRVLLGMTGSIAAYKSADLVRRLREVGAEVRVVMTENAKRFVTPLTMQAVSGYPVHDALFDLQAEAAMGHIELARWADVLLVAPASADFMARLANGIADDLLTTICLATRAPMAVAPAMNQGMWQHTLTQTNLQVLRDKHIHLFGPSEGSQACGDTGPGRMLEPLELITKLSDMFATGRLAGKRVVITAGPTQEAIDPVRCITNTSSGKMGYALAQAAQEAGADVILISGPVVIKPPRGVKIVNIINAQEMYAEVMKNITRCDIFLGVAAVGDYRCEKIASSKIHRQAGSLQLTLVPNPDIVAAVGSQKHKPFVVGFAAETENVIANAKAKRERKNMDMIIANRVGAGVGINVDDNEVTVISAKQHTALPRMHKEKLARQLIALIADEIVGMH